MAQVPDSFVPNATSSPLGVNPMSAQPVQPMQNAAPAQMEQMGAATQKLGMEVNDIGERIQNQLDDAVAKQAVTGFLQNIQTVAYGDGKDQPGYLHLKGQAAINGLPDAQAALAKAKQSALDGLGSDFQKAMFSRVANQHLMSFGTQFVDHHFTQNAQYSAQASSDESDAYIQMAANARKSIGQTDANGNPGGDFYSYSNQAIQGKQHAVFVATGAGPNDPQGVAAAKYVTTAIAHGVITRMLDDHDYKGAQAFYSSELGQGHIDESTAEMLGNAIKRSVDQGTIEDVSNQRIDNLLRSKSGGPTGINPQIPIQGGSYTANKNDDGSTTYIVPQGTAVNAAADGKVSSVSQDKDGGPYTIEVTHEDGSSTQYANLSAVNYKVGDAVMQGQQPIGLTAKGGLDYSMADKDGKAVDPASQMLPPVDRTKFSNPADAQTIIDQINKSDYSPYLKKEMAAYVDGQQKINFRQAAEIKAQTVQPLQDAYYQYADNHKASDGSPTFSTKALSQSQWATLDQINPELSVRLRELAVPGNGTPTKDNVDTVAGFILHPETITVANVKAARPNLSDSRYLSLLGDAQAMATAPAKVRAVTLDRDQLNDTLEQNGLGKIVNPQTGSDDFKTSINLRTNIRDQIDAEQTRTGKELDRDAKQKIIDATIMNTASVPRVFGAKTEPLFQMKPEELQKAFVTVGTQKVTLSSIPSDQRVQAMSALRNRGIPVTEQAIANLWVAAGKPGAPKSPATAPPAGPGTTLPGTR